MDQKYELEFMTDDEVWEMLDGIISTVGETVADEDKAVHFLSVNKMRQLQFTEAVLKYLLKNSGATVTHKLHEPFKSMGSVIIEGTDLVFTNQEWFARAAEFASNVDIYPLTNGKVRMAFTFHGLAFTVE